MEIGVQLYTLRMYCQGEKQLAETFRKVREMGYGVVQYSGCPPFPKEIKTETLKKISEDSGVRICLTHYPLDLIFNETEKTAEEHLKLGCPTVGIGAMPGEYRNSTAKVQEFVEKVNKAVEILDSYGLGLAYHNHDFEFKKVDGKRLFDIMIDDFDPRVFFTMDTCWVKAGGEDPVGWMQKLNGRMRDIHIKDWTDKLNIIEKLIWRKKGKMCPVGAGKLDFKGIFAEGEKQGINTALIELDIAPKPYVALQQSTDFLKKTFPEKFSH